MVVMINGMYVGKVDVTEYSVKELQDAGFTVIIDQGVDYEVYSHLHEKEWKSNWKSWM